MRSSTSFLNLSKCFRFEGKIGRSQGHTFLMPEGISGYNNEQDIHMTQLNHDAAENDPLFFLIVSAQIGVDTFFFLSGFLFSYLTVKELRRNARRFNKAQALVLRYIRLTPPFALAMVMFYQIWPYFASGPFGWKFQHSIYRRCDGSWWSEMLYLMNFLPFNSDDVCMGPVVPCVVPVSVLSVVVFLFSDTWLCRFENLRSLGANAHESSSLRKKKIVASSDLEKPLHSETCGV